MNFSRTDVLDNLTGGKTQKRFLSFFGKKQGMVKLIARANHVGTKHGHDPLALGHF
jgi:hypothetical protein